MTRPKHWQDAVNVVLGAWLVLSPWALRFQADTPAMANAVVIGLALLAVALGALVAPREWEEWVEGALGLWLIASPWLLGFSGEPTTMRNAVLSGVVILALALWTLATDKEFSLGRQKHVADRAP